MEMPYSNPMQNARVVAAKNLGILQNNLADSFAEEEGWLDNWQGPQNSSVTRIPLPSPNIIRYKMGNEAGQQDCTPAETQRSSTETTVEKRKSKEAKESPQEPFTLREFEIW